MRTHLLFIGLWLLWLTMGISSAQETQTDELPPPGLTIHVVQRGENLFRIALQYNTTTQELAELNGILDVSNIQVGQRLLVPALPTAAPLPQTHEVQPGETLFTIAQLYGVSVDALLAQNDIANANQIYPGQLLTIAAADEAAPQATPAAESTASPVPEETAAPEILPTPAGDRPGSENELPTISSNIHVVQAGETLFRIALRYDLSVNELASANGIADPTRIYVGQQLVIPSVPESPSANLDLPAPITSVDVRPLMFVEGETGVLQLETSAATTITGTFLGQELRVIALEEGTQHVAIVGIPVFTQSGVYPVNLFLSNADNTQTEFAFNVRVASGGYGTQNLNVSPEMANLLAPSVQENELSVLSELTSNFTPERLHEGLLSIPAAAAMNAPFGTNRSYNSGPVSAYHSGADFASAPNTPIFAAGSGRVVLADTLNIRGNATVIDHGWGIYTLYAHQTTINVSVGDMVVTGQTIGTAGSTGRVTGPHLHWEVWVHGIPVNPLQWTQQPFP